MAASFLCSAAHVCFGSIWIRQGKPIPIFCHPTQVIIYNSGSQPPVRTAVLVSTFLQRSANICIIRAYNLYLNYKMTDVEGLLELLLKINTENVYTPIHDQTAF